MPDEKSLINLIKFYLTPKRIKVIVWDFDGTLFYSPESAEKMKNIFIEILSKQNKIPMETSRKLFTSKQKKYTWSKSISNLTGLSEKKVLLLLEKSIDRRKFAVKDNKLIKMFNKLKNHRHVILTNSTQKNTILTLIKMGFKSDIQKKSVVPFEKIFSLENIKDPKPSTSAFIKVTNYTGLSPESHLMIGDFEDIDILPAKKLGFRTCKIGAKSENSDFNVNTVYEIPNIFNKVNF